jgi:hypothetical protein
MGNMTPISKNIENKLVNFYLFNTFEHQRKKDFIFDLTDNKRKIKIINNLYSYSLKLLKFMLLKYGKGMSVNCLIKSNIIITDEFLIPYIRSCYIYEINEIYRELRFKKYNITDTIRREMILRDANMIYKFCILNEKLSVEIIDLAVKGNILFANYLIDNLNYLSKQQKAKILNDNLEFIKKFNKKDYYDEFTEEKHEKLKRRVKYFIKKYNTNG